MPQGERRIMAQARNAFDVNVEDRRAKNAAKWGETHDSAHTTKNWAAIASWQLGLLQIELLNGASGGEVLTRIEKVCAPLKELYTRAYAGPVMKIPEEEWNGQL